MAKYGWTTIAATLLFAALAGCDRQPDPPPIAEAPTSDPSQGQEQKTDESADTTSGENDRSTEPDTESAGPDQETGVTERPGSDTNPDTKPRLWVFLLAGQSNMVGLGEVASLTADQSKPVADAIIWLEDSVHQNPKQRRWSPLASGLGATAGHFGPELSFGRRIRQAWPNRPIALIKVAEGGTNLHTDWKADKGRLYKLFLRTVRNQLAELKSSWRPTVAGMAWMQGESDSNARHAEAYEQNLRDFMQSVRTDLNLPNLPTTIGLIAPIPLWPKHDKIRSAQRSVADARPAVTVVDTAGYSRHSDDPAHYDTDGQLRLGKAFADSLLKLLE